MYKAQLRESGEWVAVKVQVWRPPLQSPRASLREAAGRASRLAGVLRGRWLTWGGVAAQRPTVEEAIKRDLYIIRLIAKTVDKAALERVGVDAVTLIDEFSENLLEETDYVQVSLHTGSNADCDGALEYLTNCLLRRSCATSSPSGATSRATRW